MSLLELADVNEDTRTSGLRRDKPVSLGVIPLCEPALLIHQISARLTFIVTWPQGDIGVHTTHSAAALVHGDVKHREVT